MQDLHITITHMFQNGTRPFPCHKLSLRRIYISAHEITRKHHLLLFQGQGRILAQGRLFRELRQAEGNRPRTHLRQPP